MDCIIDLEENLCEKGITFLFICRKSSSAIISVIFNG